MLQALAFERLAKVNCSLSDSPISCGLSTDESGRYVNVRIHDAADSFKFGTSRGDGAVDQPFSCGQKWKSSCSSLLK